MGGGHIGRSAWAANQEVPRWTRWRPSVALLHLQTAAQELVEMAPHTRAGGNPVCVEVEAGDTACLPGCPSGTCPSFPALARAHHPAWSSEHTKQPCPSSAGARPGSPRPLKWEEGTLALSLDSSSPFLPQRLEGDRPAEPLPRAQLGDCPGAASAPTFGGPGLGSWRVCGAPWSPSLPAVRQKQRRAHGGA